MKRDFLLSLSDIIENTEKAERFVGSMSYDEFTAHEMASYAVVRCLEIIGEAGKECSGGYSGQTPGSSLERPGRSSR